MREPENYKKSTPTGHAPNVNDPLQNTLLRYVKSAACTNTVCGNLFAVDIHVDTAMHLSPYLEDTNKLTRAVSVILTNAGARVDSMCTNVACDRSVDSTNQISIVVGGNKETIQAALDQMTAAGKKMASELTLSVGS